MLHGAGTKHTNQQTKRRPGCLLLGPWSRKMSRSRDSAFGTPSRPFLCCTHQSKATSSYTLPNSSNSSLFKTCQESLHSGPITNERCLLTLLSEHRFQPGRCPFPQWVSVYVLNCGFRVGVGQGVNRARALWKPGHVLRAAGARPI